MRVLVAGATGVLGRPAVYRLVQAGHEVHGVARTADKMDLLRHLGARPVIVSLFDPDALRQAVAGSGAVLHLATKIPPVARMRSRRAWRENDRLRTEASRLLVDAAIAAGAALYIQESVTFVYADGADRWLDEDSPVAVRPGSILASALHAEGETARFAAAGGRAVALRFGLFYAPRAGHTREMIALARRRLAAVIGDGSHYVSSVNADDAATAVAAALGAPSGIYNVCDDEPLRQREYVEALAAPMGFGPPRRIPAWLFRATAGATAGYVMRSQRVSNRRFEDATGWAPRYPSVREGFRAVAAALSA